MSMNLEERLKENPELKKQVDELNAFIDKHGTREGSLINVLHRAQEIFGYLPDDTGSQFSIFKINTLFMISYSGRTRQSRRTFDYFRNQLQPFGALGKSYAEKTDSVPLAKIIEALNFVRNFSIR